MIEIFVAYDNRNEELGSYFEECKTALESFILEKHFFKSTNFISGNACTQPNLEYQLSSRIDDKFIFVAYSHGRENALVSSGEAYIEMQVNTHFFKNTLFYSNACSIGGKLSDDLIKNGCLAFIGFSQEVKAFKIGRYKQISLNCDNHALLLFLGSDVKIYEAFKLMRDYYNQKIDELNYTYNEPILAGYLAIAESSLAFKGDKTLTKKDFFIS